jgi:hypothetical protein
VAQCKSYASEAPHARNGELQLCPRLRSQTRIAGSIGVSIQAKIARTQ